MDKSTDLLAASAASVNKMDNLSDTDVETSLNSDTEKKGTSRATWGGKIDFLLSCIGYSVGLGNVWRFPFLVYRNGGGAFLIPYTIMLVICGIPLFFMELAHGQFSSQGPITGWKVSPIFKGIGWAMLMASFMVGLYYNMIMAWVLHYFFASMTSQLPWELCDQTWNSPLCAKVRYSTNETQLLHNFNNHLYSAKGLNESYLDPAWIKALSPNKTNLFDEYNVTCYHDAKSVTCNMTSYPVNLLSHFALKLASPAEEYWDKRVLRRSESINSSEEVLWDLALCLLLAWLCVFFCLIKGVQSLGKVVYVTATFPYIFLTILLVRGVLLEGALEGIKFYVIPDFSRLADASVWRDAATQIFYALGIGFGGLQAMASYNKFHNNVLTDAVVVSVINFGTGIYAGFAIFSMVGFLAVKTGLPVDKAATSGPGLAFIAYPEGITQMPVAPLWSLLFFFMLFTLGLDSQFGMVESIISGLGDAFPELITGEIKFRKFSLTRKVAFTATVCFVMYLLGLPMCTRGGIYWFQLLDTYSASHCLLVIVFVETIALMYVYGIKNFIRDIEMMLGPKSLKQWMYFIVCWLVLSPFSIIFIFVFASINYSTVKYEDVVFPSWAEAIGWLISISVMIMIPLFAIIVYCQRTGTYKYIIEASKPEGDWGPLLEEDRENSVYEKMQKTSCRQALTENGITSDSTRL